MKAFIKSNQIIHGLSGNGSTADESMGVCRTGDLRSSAQSSAEDNSAQSPAEDSSAQSMAGLCTIICDGSGLDRRASNTGDFGRRGQNAATGRMRVRRVALLLVAAIGMLMAVTACSGTAGAGQAANPPQTLDNMYYYQGEDEASYEALQQEMVDAGVQFAAVRLGADPEMAELLKKAEPDYYGADALLRERLEKSGLTGSYPFLNAINSLRIVCADDGTDLFCIVPNKTAEGLVISSLGEASETGYAKGQELYRISGAYPVLIFADNAYIEETGGAQTAMYISDARLPEDIMSLKPRQKEVKEHGLKGLWKCAEVHDDAGAIFDLYLDFGDGGEFEYYYIRKDGGPWENKMVMHLSGTAELMGPERLSLSATTDGGTYFDAGMKPVDVNGTYEVHFIDEAGARLMMRNIDGEPFLTGLQENELIFTKENP